MSTIDSNIAIIKGIHPGFILERELKERKLTKRRFAISINEYPQLLGDCLLYTSPSPRDRQKSRMPSSA